MEEKQKIIRELEMNIKKLRELSGNIKEDILRATEDRFEIESAMKVLEQNKKREQEKMNHLNKRIDDEKKLFKKTEYENNNLANNVRELVTQIATTSKFVDEKEKENTVIQDNKKNLDEE